MNLSEYFKNAAGHGVLATADAEGKVNAAIYSRPHFINEETIAYIMTERLTHENLRSNPHAAYIFIETGEKFVGKRLYLSRIKEESDPEAIAKIRWRKSYTIPEGQQNEKRYLVYFRIDKVLPLIGGQDV
jgi:hypothetical protein